MGLANHRDCVGDLGLTNRKDYVGDLGLEHGGAFFHLEDDPEHGYIQTLRVMNLSDACGFYGAVLVEHLTVLLPDRIDREGILQDREASLALECCGRSVDDLFELSGNARLLCLAECLLSYGHFDPDDCDPYRPCRQVIQIEADGDMEFDGWDADLRVDGWEGLEEHIEAEHLNW